MSSSANQRHLWHLRLIPFYSPCPSPWCVASLLFSRCLGLQAAVICSQVRSVCSPMRPVVPWRLGQKRYRKNNYNQTYRCPHVILLRRLVDINLLDLSTVNQPSAST